VQPDSVTFETRCTSTRVIPKHIANQMQLSARLTFRTRGGTSTRVILYNQQQLSASSILSAHDNFLHSVRSRSSALHYWRNLIF